MLSRNSLFSCFRTAAILLICCFFKGARRDHHVHGNPDLSSSLTASCSFPLCHLPIVTRREFWLCFNFGLRTDCLGLTTQLCHLPAVCPWAHSQSQFPHLSSTDSVTIKFSVHLVHLELCSVHGELSKSSCALGSYLPACALLCVAYP